LFKDIRKILVLKLRNIGDVLLTVPALRALKEAFPGASVSALVNSGTEEMLTLNPLVDEVIVYRRAIKSMLPAARLKSEAAFAKGLRSRGFDLAVDLTGGDRPAILSFLSGARYRIGYQPSGGFFGKRLLYTNLVRRPVGRVHTVSRDLSLLETFGIRASSLKVDMYASPDDEVRASALLGEHGLAEGDLFVHIHPTSRWLFKCWTDEGMACIIDRLGQEGIRTVLTSGPEKWELEKVRSITGHSRSPVIDLSGRTTLKGLSVISKKALFFFGVDSAPMHIAAASGARVVGIFGPSGAFGWGPWDNSGAVVHWPGARKQKRTPYPARNGQQAFGRNLVIQKAWDCVPCGKDGCEGSKRSGCLVELSAEEVWKSLRGYMAAFRTGPAGDKRLIC